MKSSNDSFPLMVDICKHEQMERSIDDIGEV